MSDLHSHHVNLRLVTKYRVTAEFPDVPGTPSLLFDERPPVGDGRGPNAAMVLGAAIGDCLSATLMNCLIREHLDVEALTATVVTRVGRNDAGRFRISGIEVELCPTVPRGERAGLERCQAIFQDYCTVTESVREGIRVTVSLTQPASDKTILLGDAAHDRQEPEPRQQETVSR
jgi:organic hydroperoxide reductase OsmC/OhrA